MRLAKVSFYLGIKAAEKEVISWIMTIFAYIICI